MLFQEHCEALRLTTHRRAVPTVCNLSLRAWEAGECAPAGQARRS